MHYTCTVGVAHPTVVKRPSVSAHTWVKILGRVGFRRQLKLAENMFLVHSRLTDITELKAPINVRSGRV
jgi:hypothetical protein